MDERKKEPTHEPVGVTYMMVITGTKTGDTPLFAIRRVTFDGKMTRSEVLDAVKPGTRMVIRERLRVLLDGREVMQ